MDVVPALIEQIDDVFRLADPECLKAQLNRLKSFLIDISHHFQDEKRTLPEMMRNSLLKMQGAVGNGRQLIDQSQRPQQQCLDCLLFKPRLSGQIREWKASFNELFRELQTNFSEFYNAPQSSPMRTQRSESSATGSLVNTPNCGVRQDTLHQGKGKALLEAKPDDKSESSATGSLVNTPKCGVRQDTLHQGKGKALLEDKPDDKSAGLWNRDSKMRLRTWLTADDPGVRIIAVWGMGGVGKTTLLGEIYEIYKVSDVFDVVIWLTVGQHSSTMELQNCIARAINLDLSIDQSIEMRKMMLLAHLKTKKFILILHNLWSSVDLTELGVDFDNDKGSKVLLSTRNNRVIYEMRADLQISLQPLNKEEGWELFRNVAFKDGDLPEYLEHIARRLASECQGLPLLINVIAASMKDRTTVDEWGSALSEIGIIEYPNFRSAYLDSDLYSRLKWGYDCLPIVDIKNCFLYCAMFPPDEEIEVEKLVRMCIAEGLVKSKDPANLVDTAHNYIKLLVDRHWIQVTHIPNGLVFFKIHGILHDIAIYIGQHENHLFSEMECTIFPHTIAEDCKRLSLYGNNIPYLPPNELKCTELLSLILGASKQLEEVPAHFLVNLTSLRVLDLCRTQIKVLPITLWQLTELRYLDLSYTEIQDISDNIKNLCELQVLNISHCSKLKALPQTIGELSKLQFLDISGCSKLHSLPCEIHEIKNLNYFRRSQNNVSL